jgi:hypothetical protein
MKEIQFSNSFHPRLEAKITTVFHNDPLGTSQAHIFMPLHAAAMRLFVKIFVTFS